MSETLFLLFEVAALAAGGTVVLWLAAWWLEGRG